MPTTPNVENYQKDDVLETLDERSPDLLRQLFQISQSQPKLCDFVLDLWNENRQMKELLENDLTQPETQNPSIAMAIAIDSLLVRHPEGLALFYQLSSSNIMGISEVCRKLPPEDAVLWAAGLVQRRLIELRGTYFLPTAEGLKLASKLASSGISGGFFIERDRDLARRGETGRLS